MGELIKTKHSIIIFHIFLHFRRFSGFLAHDPLLRRVSSRQNIGPQVRNRHQVKVKA